MTRVEEEVLNIQGQIEMLEERIEKLEAESADYKRKWEIVKRENTELCSALKPFVERLHERRAALGPDDPSAEVMVKMKHLLLAEKVMK